VSDFFLGGTQLAQSRGRHKADQQAKDREDDQQLEQRKPALMATAATSAVKPIRSITFELVQEIASIPEKRRNVAARNGHLHGAMHNTG